MSKLPVLALLLVAAPIPAAAATFSDGLAAYQQNKVAAAERIYAAVAADPAASVEHRSMAKRELARIAWLIDGDANRALGHLAEAKQLGNDGCSTANLRARVLREAKRLADVIAESGALAASCSAERQDGVRIQVIRAMLDLAASDFGARSALFAEASEQAAKLSPDAGLGGARVRLELNIMKGDAAAAMVAWRDYFWLDEKDAPQALEGTDVDSLMVAGLRTEASIEDRLRLADLLVRVGFSDAARRYAEAHRLNENARSSPTWRRLRVYWQQRQRIEEALLRVNRGFARGRPDDATLARVQNEAVAALTAAAGATGDWQSALLKHYGLFGTKPGKTAGYPSIHLGHAVEDRRDEVRQYGREAAFRFISLDNMIANGFPSWLRDVQSVGGWATDGVIVQVRQAYVGNPVAAEGLQHDTEDRRIVLERQPRRAAEDIAKLRTRPAARLDGLRDRLALQLGDRIEAAARSKGTADLRRAFLAEYWRADYNHSMEVHEGRHAIDYSIGVDRSDQLRLEYQAKLSQLALADYPRMALLNISGQLEGDDAHSRAGTRIFNEYRQWIEANGAQVLGYDPALPALVQLDKLTDGQIRAIARSLDPLAKASGSSS